jgi:nitrogen fixation protein NifU and related proteins
MSDLDDLYQSLILDHNRAPRNFRPLDAPSGHAEGRNPMCGDVFDIGVRVENGVIVDAGFQGQGCAISKASASMMTTAIRGKTLEEARHLFGQFHRVVTGHSPATEAERAEVRKLLGCLSAFSGVAAFPIRVKCATLAWHAMMKAVGEAEAGIEG